MRFSICSFLRSLHTGGRGVVLKSRIVRSIRWIHGFPTTLCTACWQVLRGTFNWWKFGASLRSVAILRELLCVTGFLLLLSQVSAIYKGLCE